MNKLSQIELLDKEKGYQYILESAYKIIQKPLVLFDTHNSLLAHAGEAAGDPIWSELIMTGFHSVDTQRFFTEENFYDHVTNSDKYFVLRSAKLKYARMMGYLHNNENIKAAVLTMFETEAPFDEDDSQLFLKLSDVLNEVVRNDKFYTVYGRAFHEEIIRKLLDRIIKDRMIYTPHIQILYDGFTEYLYLAVVETGHCDPERPGGGDGDGNGHGYGRGHGHGYERGHGYVHDAADRDKIADTRIMLQNMYKTYKFATYSNYVVILMSSRYRVAFEELFVDRFFATFEKNDLYAGISESFENPYEMRVYYDKAVEALVEGKKKNCCKRIYLWCSRNGA